MSEVLMQKVGAGMLAPCDEDAQEFMRKLRVAQPVKVSVKRMRNYQFHKKFFALLNYAFEFWEPAELQEDPEQKWKKQVTPEKSFDRFRKDITILAGFYEAYYRLNGDVRIEAKSISFAQMDADTFEELYSKVIDVILKHIFTNTAMTEERLRETVDELMRFC